MNKTFLQGEKVSLRTIGKEDLTPTYRDWFNDAEVCLYNSHHRFPNYSEDMHEYYEKVIRSHNHLVLAIIDNESSKHIGNISLQEIDLLNQHAELAIIIGEKEFWSKGVGREACELIIAHGFSELNLHRIYCATFDTNVGMQKLALKLGFKDEGTSREQIFKNGAFRNIIRYGLLKHEFKS